MLLRYLFVPSLKLAYIHSHFKFQQSDSFGIVHTPEDGRHLRAYKDKLPPVCIFS